MIYHTYEPSEDLAALVKFYWTLEVPFDPSHERQKIIPDGNVEMTFNMGAPIRRYTSQTDYIIHPRPMVMGQRTKSYLIEPTGDVDSFAICFYPYGFASFINTPLAEIADTEVEVAKLFGVDAASTLEDNIISARDTQQRIKIIESFLLDRLNNEKTIENIVKDTIDMLITTNGGASISTILQKDLSKRRQLERKFKKLIGISPKQLGKVFRMQAALSMMLSKEKESLTHVAYESQYFDQAHFIKDFKEFVGMSPKEFTENESMVLSKLFYQ